MVLWRICYPVVFVVVFLLDDHLWFCSADLDKNSKHAHIATYAYGSKTLTDYICDDGYKFDDARNDCVPLCIPSCVKPAKCVKPDTCHCDKPLILDINRCVEPICTEECFRGTCIGNNICECNAGYVAINATHCKPVCDDCQNGECVQPGRCICHQNYIKSGLTCIPICTTDCVNGICSAPNECSCNNDSYPVPLNSTHCGSLCPAGFKNNPVECSPVCDPPCINGQCTGPNECTCRLGYKKVDDDSRCIPDTSCVNGKWVEPGVCKCDDGYSNKDSDKCAPVCHRPCLNGECSEPDSCTCNDNYEPDPGDKFNCIPVCAPQCVNATCVRPNHCECLNGYESTDQNWACKPKCSSCDNGVCVEPERCTCNENFSRSESDGKCNPVCTPQCINAACFYNETIQANECRCIEGYEKNHTNPHECFKPCEELCGACDLHGKCKCDRGFELNGNNCTKISPVEDCELCEGDCEDGCWCADKNIPCLSQEQHIPPEAATTMSLASPAMTYIVTSSGVALLLVLVIAFVHQNYKRVQVLKNKIDPGDTYGSVMYTVPHSLVDRPYSPESYTDNIEENYYESRMIQDENQRHC